MSLAKRRAAAKKYRPAAVELLLVAEAPPCDTDRYFYFERVERHDWLFRYVWEGLTGEKPERHDKPAQLAALRDGGVYMIDLHEDNVSQPAIATLKAGAPGLIDRCRGLAPAHIVLIKSIVHDAAYQPLRGAGLPVVDERIPFPSSGQQKKFLEAFRHALEAAGFEFRRRG